MFYIIDEVFMRYNFKRIFIEIIIFYDKSVHKFVYTLCYYMFASLQLSY